MRKRRPTLINLPLLQHPHSSLSPLPLFTSLPLLLSTKTRLFLPKGRWLVLSSSDQQKNNQIGGFFYMHPPDFRPEISATKLPCKVYFVCQHHIFPWKKTDLLTARRKQVCFFVKVATPRQQWSDQSIWGDCSLQKKQNPAQSKHSKVAEGKKNVCDIQWSGNNWATTSSLQMRKAFRFQETD